MNRDHNQQHVRRGPHLVRAAGPADLADRRVRFKLKTALSASAGQASAWLMPFNPDDEEYDDPEETEITVKDTLGRDFAGPIDCEGLALRRYTNAGVLYEITEMFWKARFIEFVLSAALATTDASKGATVVRYGDGHDPDPEAYGITVYNKSESGGDYMFEGDSSDEGMAVYDEHDDKYRIWQMECP